MENQVAKSTLHLSIRYRRWWTACEVFHLQRLRLVHRSKWPVALVRTTESDQSVGQLRDV